MADAAQWELRHLESIQYIPLFTKLWIRFSPFTNEFVIHEHDLTSPTPQLILVPMVWFRVWSAVRSTTEHYH